MTEPPTSQRILLADDEKPIREMLARALTSRGHTVLEASDGREALERIHAEPPDVVLLDLMMPKLDGFDVLAALRADPRTAAIQVIVLTARASQEVLKEALDAGADDYISKPFHLGEVVARVDAHLRIARYARALDRQARDGETLLDISHRLTGLLDVHGILSDVAGQVAEMLGAERCSVVLLGPDGRSGRVVAASERAELMDIPIATEGYPEIRKVVETGEPLVVSDVTADPLFDPVKDQVAVLGVRSVALFPMLQGQRCIGVLFLRSTQPLQAFAPREMQFGQIVANATAVAVRNADLFREVKEEHHRADQARAVVERRLAIVQRYEDFFENSADGSVVTDPDGRVTSMNRRAEMITGIGRSEAVLGSFLDLVTSGDAKVATALLDRARSGDFEARADVHTGANRIASVGVASIPGRAAFHLTLRDVTEERALERELAETKDFLQSLIDASPDGIIATDLEGGLRVYNKAAEAMFGYPAATIAELHVSHLYPPGGASEVMALIRSEDHGGTGQLTPPVRRDVVAIDGSQIPVLLSASLVQVHGKPVATVGIIRDLRERLAIEQRLAETEKMALLAEVAGTTAHELNQPLQSVMGYAELLKRRIPADDPNQRAATTIIQEVERMAAIVRRLGQITRYETKPYVGTTRIIDLEASAGADPEGSEDPSRGSS